MSGSGTAGATDGLASRRAAYQAVRRVHADRAWSQPAVRAALRRSRLDHRDRAFAANLAYETLRWEGTLDWALSQVVRRPLERVEPELLDVLRLGAWEVLYGAAPDHAAVATAVEVARAETGARATGFANGVLRALARRRASLPWPSRDSDRGLALATGYPEWVVAEARRRFGTRAAAVLEAGNRSPGVTLRADAGPDAPGAGRARGGDREQLLAELEAAGVDARPGVAAPEAVRVSGVDPAELAAVEQGRATVQDEASMLVAHALRDAARGEDGALPAGWRVLDACAGPGGKATHLAALGGRVVAGDVHPGRAALVAATARRLGLDDRVSVVAADALTGPWREASFDAALVDAPCSGLGTVRRRPELRWRLDPGDPARLGDLQLRLLEAVSGLVRPGGWLLYSACTWPRAETTEVAAAFSAAHGDAFDVTPVLNHGRAPTDEVGTQLDPDADEVDGMYVCSFRRRG